MYYSEHTVLLGMSGLALTLAIKLLEFDRPKAIAEINEEIKRLSRFPDEDVLEMWKKIWSVLSKRDRQRLLEAREELGLEFTGSREMINSSNRRSYAAVG